MHPARRTSLSLPLHSQAPLRRGSRWNDLIGLLCLLSVSLAVALGFGRPADYLHGSEYGFSHEDGADRTDPGRLPPRPLPGPAGPGLQDHGIENRRNRGEHRAFSPYAGRRLGLPAAERLELNPHPAGGVCALPLPGLFLQLHQGPGHEPHSHLHLLVFISHHLPVPGEAPSLAPGPARRDHARRRHPRPLRDGDLGRRFAVRDASPQDEPAGSAFSYPNRRRRGRLLACRRPHPRLGVLPQKRLLQSIRRI